MDSFYNESELKEIGFKNFGQDVKISKKVSIYSPEKISIGNHVRIDDFSILSGEIDIGDYVHISAYVALYGKFGIKIGNFCGCSPRTTIFSATDDFSGEYMISPMVPIEYTNLEKGKVELKDFSQVGANSIIMPKVTIGEGAVSGAFSFIKSDLEEWSINAGIPAKKIKDRKKNILNLYKNVID